MANSRIYITLVIVGGVAAIGGILMRFSGKPSLYEPGTVSGWSGIALVLIARVVFGRKRRVSSPTKERPLKERL